MIQALYIAKCGKCGVYPAPFSSPRKTLEEIAVSAVHETTHDAVAHAVKKGWSAYPLLCPGCGADFLRTLKGDRDEQVRGDGGAPEDGGGIPEGGQGPE